MWEKFETKLPECKKVYKIKKECCRDQGSNQGPSDLQSDALPTELSRLLVEKVAL